jgi:hypothetical protein
LRDMWVFERHEVLMGIVGHVRETYRVHVGHESVCRIQ